MRGAREEHVAQASRLAADQRMRHFWDGAGDMGEAFPEVLGLSSAAWDVYLLYDRDATWSGALPPKPAFWMHQLYGVTNAPLLDPKGFAAEADRLAEGRKPPLARP
jgi:hypothetical protein